MSARFKKDNRVKTQAQHVILPSRAKNLLNNAPSGSMVSGTVCDVEKGMVRVAWNIQGSIFTSNIDPELLEIVEPVKVTTTTSKRRKSEKVESSEASSETEESEESSSEDDEEEPSDNSPLESLLEVGPVKWIQEDRKIDPRSVEHWDYRPKVRFPKSQAASNGAHTAYDCVDMLLTDDLVDFIIRNVNDERVTREVIKVYLALKVYLAHVHKMGEIREHWKDPEDDPLGLFPMRDLRDFISRELFEVIDLKAMGLRNPNDIYGSTRELLELIGKAARLHVTPGLAVAHDESMCWFYGRETSAKAFALGKFQEGTNPPKDKIKGKPRPIGYWITTNAIRLSSALPPVMTHLEIRKSSLMNNEDIKALEQELSVVVGKFGKSCLTVLRASQPYYKSGRIIVFDSLYCGVQSVVALAKLGLYAVGTVAHCRALFPMAALKKLMANKGRGEMVFLRTKVCGVDLLAAGYRTKKLHFLLGSCGTSNPAPDIIKKWFCHKVEKILELKTPRCNMIWLFHSLMNGVDVHNHLRQYGLALEETFRRSKFERRMWDFGLGVMLTNAYALWSWETRNYAEFDASSQAFRKTFIHDVLTRHTEFGQKITSLPVRQASPLHLFNSRPHFYCSLKQIPELAAENMDSSESVRKKCAECGKRTSYFCGICYFSHSTDLYPICENDPSCKRAHEAKYREIVVRKEAL